MPVYSHSRLSSFETCPLQYRFRYIDRIKREVEGIETFLGRTVHETLLALYSDRDRARSAGAAAYVGHFRDLWRRRMPPNVRIVRPGMSADDYRAVGERCVETFYTRHHPFGAAEVVGCEQRVEFTLDAQGRYRLLGFIDRVDRPAPGVYEIHDYKTGALPRSGALKGDRQLTLYEIALRQKHADAREVRHVWHYLAHDKSFVETRSADDLDRTRLVTIRSIRAVEATTEFPARPGPLCSWCDYQGICPEWTGRVDEPPAIDPDSGQYLLFGGPPGSGA